LRLQNLENMKKEKRTVLTERLRRVEIFSGTSSSMIFFPLNSHG